MDLAAIVGRVRHALISRSHCAGADGRLEFELNGVGGPVHEEVTRDGILDRGSSPDPGAPGSRRRPGIEQHQWRAGHALHPQMQEQTTCRGPSPAPGQSFLPGPSWRLASQAAQSRADPCERTGSRANLRRSQHNGSLDRQARRIERWSHGRPAFTGSLIMREQGLASRPGLARPARYLIVCPESPVSPPERLPPWPNAPQLCSNRHASRLASRLTRRPSVAAPEMTAYDQPQPPSLLAKYVS